MWFPVQAQHAWPLQEWQSTTAMQVDCVPITPPPRSCYSAKRATASSAQNASVRWRGWREDTLSMFTWNWKTRTTSARCVSVLSHCPLVSDFLGILRSCLSRFFRKNLRSCCLVLRMIYRKNAARNKSFTASCKTCRCVWSVDVHNCAIHPRTRTFCIDGYTCVYRCMSRLLHTHIYYHRAPACGYTVHRFFCCFFFKLELLRKKTELRKSTRSLSDCVRKSELSFMKQVDDVIAPSIALCQQRFKVCIKTWTSA